MGYVIIDRVFCSLHETQDLITGNTVVLESGYSLANVRTHGLFIAFRYDVATAGCTKLASVPKALYGNGNEPRSDN